MGREPGSRDTGRVASGAAWRPADRLRYPWRDRCSRRGGVVARGDV